MASSMQKINNFFKNLFSNNNNNTTRKGKVYPNKMNFLYDKMRIENDRLKAYEECWVMYVEDPRVSAAIDTTAGSATNGSFTVHFNKAETKSESLLKDADDIINGIKKRCQMDLKILGIAKELLILGDAFLEVIIDYDKNEIANLKKLPARSIFRIEDEYGVLQGFEQRNELNEVIANFEPWQILHMKWNHFSGQKYGTSMIRSIRSVYKKLKMTEEDLVVRRRTRAGLKLHHYGADPLEPLDPDEVDEYIGQNTSSPLNVRTDFYSNGKWKIDVLKSDDGVSQIEDIKHLEDALFIGLRTPKGLLGVGEDPNRATLERQEVAYIRLLNEVTNVISDQIIQVFDLGLNLQGINPDTIEYELIWSEKTVEDVNNKAERLVLLTNAGFISKETATGQLGYNFDDEQYKIEMEIKNNQNIDYSQMNPNKFIDPASIIKSSREKVKYQKRSDDGKENTKTTLDSNK